MNTLKLTIICVYVFDYCGKFFSLFSADCYVVFERGRAWMLC